MIDDIHWGDEPSLSALRPEAIASSLRERLDDLGVDHRALAEAVAVLGPGARIDDAAALAGLSPSEAALLADQLCGVGRGRPSGLRARHARLRGDPAQSVRLLRRALEERPPLDERAELLTELALTEASIGAEDALAHLEEATELGGPPSDRARACLELGKLLTSRGREDGGASGARSGAGARGPP